MFEPKKAGTCGGPQTDTAQMIEPTPRWTFASRHAVTQWYGHVHLLPNCVLGQWCCLERDSGKLVWEKRFHRPNTIRAVTDEVVVASETRSDGPWAADFGCYGISMRTGELLWTSHAQGWWGRALRLLDFVPGFANELRDRPHHVIDNEVYCITGRVLDVRTGALLRHVSRQEVQQFQEPRPDVQQLCDSRVQNARTKILVGDNMWLSHKKDENEGQLGEFQLYLLDNENAVKWKLESNSRGMHIADKFYSYRYVSYRLKAPFVYLVVSVESNYKQHPSRPYRLQNPTRYHLLSFDIFKGQVVGDILLDENKVTECRIEEVDDQGLLVSVDQTRLKYFQQSSITPR